VNAATRTLRARSELGNPGGRLKPGMFATLASHRARKIKALLVPSEAVIRTGERSVVIVAESEGKFGRMRSSSASNRRQERNP